MKKMLSWVYYTLNLKSHSKLTGTYSETSMYHSAIYIKQLEDIMHREQRNARYREYYRAQKIAMPRVLQKIIGKDWINRPLTYIKYVFKQVLRAYEFQITLIGPK